jgi:hypothetical protein
MWQGHDMTAALLPPLGGLVLGLAVLACGALGRAAWERWG